MGRSLALTLVAVAVVVLEISGSSALPAAASARPTGVAPPGNSGVSQYVEDLPTVTGDKPSSGIVIPNGAGGSAPTESNPTSVAKHPPVPASVVRQLDRAGSAGRSTANTAVATAPPSTHFRQPKAPPQDPKSTAGQFLKALGGSTGGGGLGGFLPVLLIVILLVVSAVGIFQRRTSP